MEQVIDQIRQLTGRIASLEATANPTQEDYSDPPLYLIRADGTPISPDSIEDIPDIVKGLPNFNGDPNELSFFLQDAEALVSLYTPNIHSTVDDKNKYHVVCKSIRRKIKGEANDALVASNVNINWKMIRKTLTTYYGEKRDLETLDYQLMCCKQDGETLEKYYDKVNRILSLIANSIRTDERFSHPEATKAMIYTYNRKAIDAFIRGLDGDVGRFLKNYEPESLAHAYSYCISFQNIEFRKNITSYKIPEVHTKPRNLIPAIPPKPAHLSRMHMKPLMNLPQLRYNPPMHFYPPKPFYNTQQQRNYPHFHPAPPRQPFVPQPPPNPQRNPFRAPAPIDTDVSMRTANINYSNRPQHSNQQHPPLKRPRLFHTHTESYQNPEIEDTVNERSDFIPSDDEEYYPEPSHTFDRYLRAIEAQQDQPNEFQEPEEAELNFLE